MVPLTWPHLVFCLAFGFTEGKIKGIDVGLGCAANLMNQNHFKYIVVLWSSYICMITQWHVLCITFCKKLCCIIYSSYLQF